MRYLPVLLGLLGCVQSDFVGESNDIKGNPFSCHMFENHELNYKVFVKELGFLRKLHKLRDILSDRRTALLKEQDLNTKVSKKDVVSDIKEMTRDFPNGTDFEGAINGMILLFDTYNYDIPETLKGNLKIPYFAATGKELVLKVRTNLFY